MRAGAVVPMKTTSMAAALTELCEGPGWARVLGRCACRYAVLVVHIAFRNVADRNPRVVDELHAEKHDAAYWLEVGGMCVVKDPEGVVGRADGLGEV